MTTLLVAESTVKEENASRGKIIGYALAVLLVTLVFLFANLGTAPEHIFHNAITIDPFSTLIKIIMVLGTMGAIFLSYSSKDIYPNLKSEFAIMAVGVLIGGMLLASANNMLTLYLGIETLSILSYVMSSFKRDEASSTEAGMKYALYGGLSAGVALYGISHLSLIDLFYLTKRNHLTLHKIGNTLNFFSTFSTFFSHHISTMEGGLVITDNEELYHIMLSLRAHGWTRNLPDNNFVSGEKSKNPFDESFKFVLPNQHFLPQFSFAILGFFLREIVLKFLSAFFSTFFLFLSPFIYNVYA
jgi:hypothetical protein